MSLPKPKAILFDWNYTLVDVDVGNGANAALYEGMEDLLKTLHQQGVYLGVVSNEHGDIIRSVVKEAGLDPYFNKVVGIGDAQAGKPSPDPIHVALKGSGVEASPAVWFVGDSHTDIASANNAGCSALLINTKSWPIQMFASTRPDAAFETHKELQEFIKGTLGV